MKEKLFNIKLYINLYIEHRIKELELMKRFHSSFATDEDIKDLKQQEEIIQELQKEYEYLKTL